MLCLLLLISTLVASLKGKFITKDHVISKREAVTRLRQLWPAVIDYDYKVSSIIIPYTVKKGFWWWSGLVISDETNIREAMSVIEKHTCIRFVPRKRQRDYIEFLKDNENNFCASDIGRQGGKQNISLSSGCRNPGHVTHEIMHSLGFYHEQSRPDRDNYVKILWDNIKPGKEKQFKIRSLSDMSTLGQPYDFRSIMHYTRKEFSKNGEDTIQAVQDPEIQLGTDSSLSAIDILQLNRLYRCPQAAKEVHNYHVTVSTGSAAFAGTDANVFVELYGYHGDQQVNSGELQLLAKEGHFESGSKDSFNVISPDLGLLTKMTVRHNNQGVGPAWFLGKIKVVDDKRAKTYLFPCSCWLSGPDNTNTLFAEILENTRSS